MEQFILTLRIGPINFALLRSVMRIAPTLIGDESVDEDRVIGAVVWSVIRYMLPDSEGDEIGKCIVRVVQATIRSYEGEIDPYLTDDVLWDALRVGIGDYLHTYRSVSVSMVNIFE